MALKNKEEKRALAQTYKTKKLRLLGITLLIRENIIKRLHFNKNMINLLNGMDLILLNINFRFGLKPVFFWLYFKHDINVVPNDVHIINFESMRNISYNLFLIFSIDNKITSQVAGNKNSVSIL